MAKGKLVSIEGLEGSGKSTLADLLKSHYKSKGVKVLVSREPGGLPLGERIRDILVNEKMDPMTELLLFMACRNEHIEEVIKPELEKGTLVIIDRFYHSSLAMQGVARGLGLETVRDMHKPLLKDLNLDLAIYLDIQPTKGLARKLEQNEINRFELESLSFHKQVEIAYKHLIKQGELERIDADRTMGKILKDSVKLIDNLF